MKTDEPQMLLATKLFVPTVRPQAIARPRLVERLEAGIARAARLSLIAAPTGFGKTSLLAAWSEKTDSSVAWLSLDRQDNDPARFFLYVVAALQTVEAGVGEQAQHWLNAPQMPPLQVVLTTLLNDLSAHSALHCLVLNDYHLIEAPAIHAGLEFFLDHLPPTFHLVIASRSDPPLPLAQLRARGALTELRANDLRFSRDETAAFLNGQLELDLSPVEISTLYERTEGWIAGLQLAALSLQQQPDRHKFIQAFAGSHHYIMDYLTDEVLSQQPVEIRRFLLQTAILERLSGPLCDALTGRQDGQMMLEALERTDVFLVALDEHRQWFRYHHLFADLLRHRLTLVEGVERAHLHQRASAWYEENGFPDDALEHALLAADWDRAERLFTPRFFPMLIRGRQFTTRRWLEMFPESVRRSRPQLSLYHAWVLLFTGQVDAYEIPLRRAEASWQAAGDEAGLGQAFNLRANVARLRRDATGTLQYAAQATALLPESDLFQRSISLTALGAGYLLQGEVDEAEQRLRDAEQVSEAAGNFITRLIAMNRLGDALVLRGKLREAATVFQSVLELAGERPLWQRVEALIGLADLHREWDELESAETYLEEGLALAHQTERTIYLAVGYMTAARLRAAEGRWPAAAEQLDKALATAQAFGHDSLLENVRAQRAGLALVSQGAYSPVVQEWLAGESLTDDDAKLDYEQQSAALTQARVYLAVGQAEVAHTQLERLLRAAQDAGRDGDAVLIQLLLALACRAMGHMESALAVLASAAAVAEGGGYRRAFVDEGAAMAELLARLVAREPAWAYLQGLQEAIAGAAVVPRTDPPLLLEPLTEREQEILRHIAAGATNRAIAEALVISIHTVKKHISNIYGKLDVNSRTRALVKARDLGLL